MLQLPWFLIDVLIANSLSSWEVGVQNEGTRGLCSLGYFWEHSVQCLDHAVYKITTTTRSFPTNPFVDSMLWCPTCHQFRNSRASSVSTWSQLKPGSRYLYFSNVSGEVRVVDSALILRWFWNWFWTDFDARINRESKHNRFSSSGGGTTSVSTPESIISILSPNKNWLRLDSGLRGGSESKSELTRNFVPWFPYVTTIEIRYVTSGHRLPLPQFVCLWLFIE
jgi:hypothetical protein